MLRDVRGGRGRRVVRRMALGCGGLALFLSSCATHEEISGQAIATVADAATYGASACLACVDLACATEVHTCAADPECGTYMQCLRECPLAATGNVESTCESGCPRALGSVGAQAISELEECRQSGLGSICSLCGDDQAVESVLDQTCEPSVETNKCYRCEDEHCCETYANYASDVEGAAFKRCLEECFGVNGERCEESCFEAHPKGMATWTPRLACIQLYCGDQDACNDIPLDACQKCINRECVSSLLALYVDPLGYLFSSCTTAATDAADREACLLEYPTARPLFEAFGECALSQCGSDCS